MEENVNRAETVEEDTGGVSVQTEETAESLRAEREEFKDKYLRLYAEFDNYRKKTQKDKEELVRYSNESLIYDLLPVIDSMDMALKHAAEGGGEGVQAFRQGLENTLKEMNKVLEKFGVTAIEAAGKEFDPTYHHAMSQVERNDMDDNIVVEEYRKGYMFREKVLRASMVSVSKKPAVSSEE